MALPEFPPPFLFQVRIPPLEGLVDEDNVIPDALDALPGNVKLLSPAEESKKPAGTVDHNGDHLSLRDTDVHVGHEAKPAAVTNVDDLLTPQIPDPALHHPSLLVTKAYALPRLSYAPRKRQNLPV